MKKKEILPVEPLEQEFPKEAAKYLRLVGIQSPETLKAHTRDSLKGLMHHMITPHMLQQYNAAEQRLLKEVAQNADYLAFLWLPGTAAAEKERA